MPSTTVWLVRHGLAEGSQGRCCGRYDQPLSSEGVLQSQRIAEYLGRRPISQVYSSKLQRALQTARIVAEPHGLEVCALEELAEIHFGDIEGLTYPDIEERFPEVFRSWMNQPTQTKFPNGESFAEMRERVLGVLASLLSRHPHQSVAVVTHAGVIRVLLGQALSIPDTHVFRLAQREGAINRIDYFEHGAIVELLNAAL
jgi:alpha-ribazole phosphatase/probable phosphoglycerate mutase